MSVAFDRFAAGRITRDIKSVQLNGYRADDDWTVVECMKTEK
jgi:hypothetical protein